MISGYKKVNLNNEEVLVIYINYDYEFGDLNKSFKDIKTRLSDFIKVNKISLNGRKILFQIGGIVMASLLLTSSGIKDEQELSNEILNNNTIVSVKKDEVKDNDILKQNNEEYKNDNVEQLIDEVKDKNGVNNLNDSESNLIQNNSENNLNNHNKIQKTESKSLENNSVVSKDATSSNNDIVNSNEIIEQNPVNKGPVITVYRSNGSVIEITLEEYLIGVIGAEMPASFNIEALKAQAVIARTYALKSIEQGKRLTDTVSTQAYKDNDELKNMWGNNYNTYYNKIKSAVVLTDGLTVKYQGKYIDALYHSTSNGKTENSSNVFSNQFPYLVSVDSSWDLNVSSYQKDVYKELSFILSTFGVYGGDIKILSRNESGRVSEVMVGDKIVSGVQFRNSLGLRSADFDIQSDGSNVKITTRGFGHGVGMSQYGANEMAKEGYSYIDIIKHYYTGVSVS